MTAATKSRRIWTACAVYVAVAVLVTLVVGVFRQSLLGAATPKYALVPFGPVLSMFTHMGLPLFLVQSLALFPFIVAGVLWPRWRPVAVLGFLAAWGYIGWTMADVF